MILPGGTTVVFNCCMQWNTVLESEITLCWYYSYQAPCILNTAFEGCIHPNKEIGEHAIWDRCSPMGWCIDHLMVPIKCLYRLIFGLHGNTKSVECIDCTWNQSIKCDQWLYILPKNGPGHLTFQSLRSCSLVDNFDNEMGWKRQIFHGQMIKVEKLSWKLNQTKVQVSA